MAGSALDGRLQKVKHRAIPEQEFLDAIADTDETAVLREGRRERALFFQAAFIRPVHDDQAAAPPQPAREFPEQRQRIGEIRQHVDHQHQIEQPACIAVRECLRAGQLRIGDPDRRAAASRNMPSEMSTPTTWVTRGASAADTRPMPHP